MLGASRDSDVVVRIRLTKPRVRLLRVVAPELLVVDGLDLLTGLSTLAYLHPTTRSVRSDIAEKPGRIPSQDWYRTSLVGYSPADTRSITRRRGLRANFANGDDDHA